MAKNILRFGDFELDLAAHQLRKLGIPVKVEKRPFELLVLLASRPNVLVSREEIVKSLWPRGVIVDFDVAVNTLARKARQALGDSPARPAFIETVPGAGYRFVAAVTAEAPPADPLQLAQPVRIGVLPFENLSGDDVSYLATGLAEETSTSLAHVGLENVAVISHVSLRTHVRAGHSLRAMAEALGADYLVASSLRAEQRRVRVTTRLVRSSDDVQIWSTSFDRELIGVLELQRELAVAIAEQIRLRLSPSISAALISRQTKNPSAYDHYLRGRHQWGLFTPAASKHALEQFRHAIRYDGAYALAWAGVAQVLCTAPIVNDAAPAEIGPLAREAVENAIRYGPQSSEARYAQGYFHLWLDWNWPLAERALREAVSLDTNNAIAYMMLGHVLSQLGQHVEASAVIRRARELEPMFSQTFALSAQIAFQRRDYAQAAEFARQAIAIAPEAWIGHLQLGQAQTELGEHETAAASFERAQRFSEGNSKSIAYHAVLLARSGNDAGARAAISALDERSREHFVPPYTIALVHAALGERDRAFEHLRRACDARDVHLAFLPVDCRWDDLRADSRFEALLRQCAFFEDRA